MASQEIKDLIKLAATTTEFLTMFYHDLLQPGVREVGIALGTVLGRINVKLLRLRIENEEARAYFARYMNAFREKLSSIPSDRICEVPPEIGVPIVEKLTYVTDDYISELFLNLLTTAANKDTLNLAHPSFIRVIEHLSGDEARIMLKFRDKVYYAWVYQRYGVAPMTKEFGSRYAGLEETPGLLFPENMEVYLSNLEGLGILRRRQDPTELRLGLDPSAYDEVIQLSKKLENKTERVLIEQDQKHFHFEEGFIAMTAYGRMFIQACTAKIPL